jgi:excisionase family DNA binding protein
MRQNSNCVNVSFEYKDHTEIFENRIDSEWLTTVEAASYLRITPNALRVKVCRKLVRAFRIGRQLRFRLRDLRSLINFRGD